MKRKESSHFRVIFDAKRWLVEDSLMPRFRVISSTGHSRSFLVLVTSPRSQSPRFNWEKRCCYSACLLQWLSASSHQGCGSYCRPQRDAYHQWPNSYRDTPLKRSYWRDRNPEKHPQQSPKNHKSPTGSAETSKKHKLHSEGAETSL